MTKRIFIFISLLAAVPVFGNTLAVNASATPDSSIAGAFDYTYDFTVSGVGSSYDEVALGSDDLSPLNLTITLDNAAAPDWSWLGNSDPNYLLFFSSGAPLQAGDVLGVTFLSGFAPEPLSFVQAFNSSTSADSNQITNVAGPSSVPEPGTMGLSLLAISGLTFLIRKARA